MEETAVMLANAVSENTLLHQSAKVEEAARRDSAYKELLVLAMDICVYGREAFRGHPRRFHYRRIK